MGQLWKKQIIGIKTEADQGSVATLAETDFTTAWDVKITAKAEQNPQNYVSTSLSRFADIPGKKYYELEFTLPFKASGTAGTPNSPLGSALKASMMTETVSGGVSVVYAFTSAPVSASYYGPGKSCTVKIYRDGMLHVAVGCMFTFSFVWKAGSVVAITFKGMGLYAAVTDAAFPTNTPLTNLPKIAQSCSYTLQSYAGIISEISFDAGITVAMSDDVNSTAGIRGFQCTDRNPVGKIDPERVLVATHNFYSLMMAGTEGALSMVLGAGSAGHIITVTAPKVQYQAIEEGERSGIAILNTNLKFNRNAGDDELVITMT